MNTNIYIVEDHPIMRKTLQECLKRLPDSTICGVAASAQEALTGLSIVAADLAIVDVSLPDMSGVDLIEQVRVQYPNLYCLMLSGHQEIGSIQQALAVGAHGYIIKGNPRELFTAIQQVLAGTIYLSDAVRQKLENAKGEEGDLET